LLHSFRDQTTLAGVSDVVLLREVNGDKRVWQPLAVLVGRPWACLM
jgi:hypothetical protein